jgi:hypothetical protein
VSENTGPESNGGSEFAQPAHLNQYPFLPRVAVALPALGLFEFEDVSVSGSGEVAPELLRPPPLGRPIRLFDSIEAAAGNLDGGRIVIFEWSEGICGRVFRPSVLRSSLEE